MAVIFGNVIDRHSIDILDWHAIHVFITIAALLLIIQTSAAYCGATLSYLRNKAEKDVLQSREQLLRVHGPIFPHADAVNHFLLKLLGFQSAFDRLVAIVQCMEHFHYPALEPATRT